MNIFIDTNSLEKRSLRTDVFLNSLFDYCDKYSKKVYISNIVMLELTHHKIREFDYIKQFMKKWGNVYRKLADEDIVNSFTEVDVGAKIQTLLMQRGVTEIVHNTAEDISYAVESLYLGRKPAKSNLEAQGLNKIEPEVLDGYAWRGRYEQNGMKDVFIWRAFVRLVQTNPQEEFVFISDNTSDFAAPKKKKGKAEEKNVCLVESFHDQLCSDLGESLNRVVYLTELDQFITQHVNPIEEFSETAAITALKAASDLVVAALSEVGFDEDVDIMACTAVVNKEIKGFQIFSCSVDMQLMSGSDEVLTATFRLTLKAVSPDYEIVDVTAESEPAILNSDSFTE